MMSGAIIEYFVENFAMYFLIIAFLAITLKSDNPKEQGLKFMLFSIALAVLISIVCFAEEQTSLYPSMVTLRTWLSYIGFCLRPATILFLILALEKRHSVRIIIFIPEILNILVFSLCFFTDKVFTFNENYDFVRGPLGYFIFIATAFYYICFLAVVYKSYTCGRRREFQILVLCSAMSVIAILMDVLFYGNNINISVIICCIFYYLFINSNYSGLDALTGLQNRKACYKDSAWKPSSISAVAAIDMNGLKTLNDTKGHGAGDVALKAIGVALGKYDGRYISAYRVGGDEFLMIFREQDTLSTEKVLSDIRAELQSQGIDIAYGYSFNANRTKSFDILSSEADERMYVDKARYYTEEGHDRRVGGCGKNYPA